MASIRDLILNVVEKKEGNALVAAANDLDKLSHGMDAGSDKTKQYTKDTEKLNAEIEKSTARVKELHKQFAASGDTSLFGDIRKEETNIRNLRKTLQVLATDAHDAGKDVGQSLFGGIASGFQGAAGTPVLGPILIGAITGALISLGPILVSELGGLVAGAVGTVGVLGGVLSAIKSPQVKSAFTEFMDDIQNEFFGHSEAFVEPIRRSLAVLARDFADLNLGEAFARAAPYVQVIAEGIGNFAKNIMPGFNVALSRSGPFAKATADGLADLGLAIGYLVDRVTQSKGSLEGLKTLFAFVSALVVGVADIIYHAGEAYDWFLSKQESFFRGQAAVADFFGAHGFADKLLSIAEAMHQLRDSSEPAQHAIEGLGGSIEDTDKLIDHFNNQLAEAIGLEENMINVSLDLDNAILAMDQGWLDLNDQLVKGKQNWDDTTKAGIANQQMLNDQIKKIDAVRLAEIAKSDGSINAINAINAEYDKQLAKLLAVAQAAGDSKAALEALAKKYFIDVIVTRVEQNQITKSNAVDRALSNLLGFATGGFVPGPVGSPHLALVHGGERVLTPAQQTSGVGGGASQVVISFAATGDSLLDSILLAVRKYVRINGGDVQTALMN